MSGLADSNATKRPEAELHEASRRRMVGCVEIARRLRESDDPNDIADGAFLLAALNDIADYVALLRGIE